MTSYIVTPYFEVLTLFPLYISTLAPEVITRRHRFSKLRLKFIRDSCLVRLSRDGTHYPKMLWMHPLFQCLKAGLPEAGIIFILILFVILSTFCHFIFLFKLLNLSICFFIPSLSSVSFLSLLSTV